ncbi:ribonuclease III [Candidatus Parcubacteria bacterium]|nr:ribonuclease III [Candidatus Parcubacteria bacterium]
MKDISLFEKKIGVSFSDKGLINTAFTHRSYINENPHIETGHNERLEFLGDAVLELIITRYLFDKYPNDPEGELTAYRSALVNTISLAESSEALEVNDFLMLSKGEAKDAGRARQHILANAFEAIIGAIYLDQGYDAAEKFISETLYGKIDKIVKEGSWRDAKSWVQEKSQEEVGVTPAYAVLHETGPDHDKNFTAGIYFGDELIAKGKGKSKQDAEQDAAREALKVRGWIGK